MKDISTPIQGSLLFFTVPQSLHKPHENAADREERKHSAIHAAGLFGTALFIYAKDQAFKSILQLLTSAARVSQAHCYSGRWVITRYLNITATKVDETYPLQDKAVDMTSDNSSSI